MGYHRAGFEVVGVDIEKQPHYPFAFILGDALDVLARMLKGEKFLASDGRWYGLEEFDAIHASPPCQGYSALRAMHPGQTYPMLIDPVRALLSATGKPYIIENVERAPLSGIVLCGSMFGLSIARGHLRRHRRFETSFPVVQPPCAHVGPTVGVYGHGGHSGKHRMLYRVEAAAIMGIDWMNRDELAQAIPPAYTEYIGLQLLAYLEAQ